MAIDARTSQILDQTLEGSRMTAEDALYLWRHANFRDLGSTAVEIRNRLNPANEVSYTAFRVVNYTNYCNVECTFCSFMDEVGSGKGYNLRTDEILRKVDEAIQLDSPQLFLQGGVNPDLAMSYYTDTLAAVKAKFPEVHIRAFSPVEVLFMAKVTGLDLAKVFGQLKAAGMHSFPGAGAEILTDRMRDILSPKKASTADWLRAMRVAQQNGLKSSTNIVWGSEEHDDEIISHLAALRDLQDVTSGILSFVPWTFQAQTKKFKLRKVAPHEYLKMIALSRLFLDNIPHIEVSIMVAGKQLGELALHFGADDINSPVIEENVLRSFGLKSTDESRRFIEDAGFAPVRRSFNYLRGAKTDHGE
jgi:cyclic dehypoxanthinyl futalosine synthase